MNYKTECLILYLASLASFLSVSTMAQEVLERWQIGNSELDYRGSKITLRYPISDLVPDNTAEIMTFSDEECVDSIFGNDYLVPQMSWDSNPNPDGTKNREVTISYTLDYEKIKNSPVYTEVSEGKLKIQFCVTFVLLNGATPMSALATGVAVEVGSLMFRLCLNINT